MIERTRRRRELFAAAFDLPPERRSGFLALECPDEELRQEVAELLAVAPPEDFLEPPELLPGPALPDRCGRFQRLRPLAERGPDCHLGQDPQSLQLVELRLLPAPDRGAERVTAQWVRTVLAIEQLASPHLPRVEGHGLNQGRGAVYFWTATAFLPGDGLDSGRHGDRPADPAHWLGVLHELAALLAAAHRLGISHGELHPGAVVQPSGAPFQLAGLGWRTVRDGGHHEAEDHRAFAALLGIAADQLGSGPATAGLRELQQRFAADPAAAFAGAAEALAELRAGRPLPPPPRTRRWWPWFGRRRSPAEPPR